ncbi:HepT-like ribonuclease domain-containing protein [Arachidicoccus soli]|uniref:HepT-like ribonuclease domain-containing protein n=1 Tax=Arachidicoccus soli TaxID=2341117 RepID=UPI0019697157|nr:HepT-like ribonuclease domain-containing protein [Arachidicoccus soli]
MVRSLEIIGEANNKLDPDFKMEHPEIEWRKIIGTRHKLIHDYFGVDYDIVWDIITNKLSDLLDFIEQIIEE